MPKIKVCEEEWYPVYELDSYGKEVDLPQSLIDRHEAALKEFEAVQFLIYQEYKKVTEK